MKKVAFYTLGCKLNYSETSAVSRLFEQKGYEKTDFDQEADIYVINTCSVTEHADRKCRKVVQEALKHSPQAYIVVMGCYAQLKPEQISQIPGVDAVLGAAEKFRLFDYIKDFEKKPKTINPITNQIEKADIFASPIQEAIEYHAAYSLNDRTRTFLKVQDGCDYSCSFCTIPRARGASRSDSIAGVLEAATQIGNTGIIKEIVLTGVNIGDFGLQQNIRNAKFIDLIKVLDELDTIERFRISSIEPNLLTDEIIEFVANSKHFVPHFHIPLQSGSDKTLSAMRRRYKTQLYADRVAKIKSLMPDACIGVDVIVGFPGETDQDFLDSYQFINQLDIAYLHVFTYSERADTLAISMPNPVKGATRQNRNQMLQILSEKKKRAFYESQIGKNFKVLFENKIDKDGNISGLTPNYIRVQTRYDPLLVGEIMRMQIGDIAANGLADGIQLSCQTDTHSELIKKTPAINL